MKLEERLAKIRPDEWANLRAATEEDAKARSFYEREWWHVKFYKRAEDKDADHLQFDPNHNCWEVPNEREVFYPSPKSRFGLDDQPVAYFASGPDISETELQSYFRDCEQLAFDALFEWACGKLDPDPSTYGFALNYALKHNAVVLDLSFPKNRIFELVDRRDHGFLKAIVESRNESAYEHTQALARCSFANGYDGLIWDSVRAPRDVNLDRKNLVVFRKTAIAKWSHLTSE